MNVWSFTARLARDAEVEFTQSGDAVTNFSSAVDSGFGDKKKTTWVNCVMWGKRGESVAPYLTKGAQVAVTGEVTNREYTDKDGNKRTSLELRVNDVTLVGGKSEEKEYAPKSPKNSDFDDSLDVPF